MSSTFYGLQISKTGLFSSQKGMELVGHNIANASTAGYTRQVLNQSSIEGMTTQSVIASGQIAQVGGGVEVNYIQQIRNQFLDAQYRTENSECGEWSVKADAYYYVENVFKEPSDTGISTVLNNFYSSLSQLSNDASSKDIRNLVRQNAVSVCETVNYYASQLEQLQNEQDEGIVNAATEINTMIKQIASLNQQIVRYEMTGEKANDLNDKRNLLIDKIAALVDVEYVYNDQNEVSIYFGKNKELADDRDDYCLLDANNNNAIYELTTTKDKAGHYATEDTHHTLTLTSKGGNTIEITGDDLTGGNLKGYFDLRDGDSADNMGIKYFLNELDTFARGIVKGYNDVHNKGYTIPDTTNGNTSTDGVNFFDDLGDIDKVNASNMALSEDIVKSIWNIAASDKEINFDNDNSQVGNNNIALELVQVATKSDLDYIGNTDNFLAGIVSDLGVTADQANQMYDNQYNIITNVDNLRLSVSGVSLDEEVTYLIQYQKAYQASARVMTAIDQMLDKLINGTGSVGL